MATLTRKPVKITSPLLTADQVAKTYGISKSDREWIDQWVRQYAAVHPPFGAVRKALRRAKPARKSS